MFDIIAPVLIKHVYMNCQKNSIKNKCNYDDKSLILFWGDAIFNENGVNSRAIIKFSKNIQHFDCINSQWIDSKAVHHPS